MKHQEATRTCFVIMPFSKPFERYYKKIYIPAIKKAGLAPVRTDSIFRPSPIVSDIWNQIQLAEVVLADVTGQNGNVFYELGLAHASQKPVVIITASLQDVPFDLRGLRIIEYDQGDPTWATRLKAAISRSVAETLRDPHQTIPAIFMQNSPKRPTAEGDPLAKHLGYLTQELRALRSQLAPQPAGSVSSDDNVFESNDNKPRLAASAYLVSQTLKSIGAATWQHRTSVTSDGEIYIRLTDPSGKVSYLSIPGFKFKKAYLRAELRRVIALNRATGSSSPHGVPGSIATRAVKPNSRTK